MDINVFDDDSDYPKSFRNCQCHAFGTFVVVVLISESSGSRPCLVGEWIFVE